MRGQLVQALKKDIEVFGAVLLILGLGLGFASPVAANRTIVIDENTDEVWSDADNAQVVPLSFPVNYGAGPQSTVAVQLPSDFSGSGFAAVGLTFPGTASDALFATISGGGGGTPQVPGMRMNNESEVSTPANPVDDASTFMFGDVTNADMAPPPPGSPLCEMSAGGIRMCYGPITSAAIFQFVNESASGSSGDFELILTCGNGCGNIGFNLGGLNFSADDFDPNAAQLPQFVSYAPIATNFPSPHGTWTFLFRNTAAVPEPSSWASMLIGFGLLGGAIRRQSRRKLKLG